MWQHCFIGTNVETVRVHLLQENEVTFHHLKKIADSECAVQISKISQCLEIL